MRRNTLKSIWVITPQKHTKHGEITFIYANPRMLRNVNIQTDYNERDVAEYGARTNEMLRLRTLYLPDIHKGDHIYLTKPDSNIAGDYEVIAIKPGYGTKLKRNPTIVDIRKVTK